MKHKIGLCVALVLTFSSLGFAFNKPDFNGEWVLDRARSFGMPPTMTQTMTVKQTETQIEVDMKLIEPNNERTVKDTYILDGKEHEFNPPAPANAAPDAPKPTGKRTSTWLPNNAGIMVTEQTTTQTPNGAATTQIVRKWTFTASGEMTIDMFIDNARGSFETKRIFKKKTS